MEPTELTTSTETKLKYQAEFLDNSVIYIIQNVILLITLGFGILSLLAVIIEGCRNSFTLSVLLLSGMLLEVYSSFETNRSSILMNSTNALDVLLNSCVEFHAPCLIANGAVLLTLTLAAVKINVPDMRRRISLRNVIFVFVIIGSIGLLYRHIDTSYTYNQNAVYKTGVESIYLTVCQEDVKESLPTVFLETALLYFPVFVVLSVIYKCNAGKGMDSERIKFIQPCYKSSPFTCRICKGLNSTYTDILGFYGVVLLVFRPVMFLYCYHTGGMIRDMLPPVLGVAQYIYLCYKCGYSLLCRDDASVVNSDGLESATAKEKDRECIAVINII